MDYRARMNKAIKKAIEEKQAGKIGCPSNLFDFTVSALTKAGFKKLSANDEYRDGDIMRVSGKKDDGSFCVIESGKAFRKSVRPKIEKQEVYRL